MMRSMPKRFVSTWLAALAFSATHAEVVEHTNIVRYPVSVQPPQTLKQALNAATPIRENGQVFHGHTKWWVNWNFRWVRQPSGRCAITSVSVDLSTQMQLPQLVQAPAADRERFDRFLPRLTKHEEGHRDNGRAAAAEVERRITQLPEMPSCELLEATANDTGRRVVSEFNQRDRQFDDATEHGKTQGAWLAP